MHKGKSRGGTRRVDSVGACQIKMQLIEAKKNLFVAERSENSGPINYEKVSVNIK